MRRSALSVTPLVLLLALGSHASGSSRTQASRWWRYDVTASGDAHELSIEAIFPAGSAEELSVESGTEPFLRDVREVRGDRQVEIKSRGTSWFVPSCAARGCRIRYRFALLEAAKEHADPDLATQYGEALESPPGAWLLRPLGAASDARVRVTVKTAPGIRFATGIAPATGARAGTYELDAVDLPRAPYSVFGALVLNELKLEDRSVEVAFVPLERRLAQEEIVRWIRSSVQMVARYFGRFPLEHALVLVLPARRDRIHGRVLGGGGATVLLWLGPDATNAKLYDDWVLVHELVHTGFPTVPRRHHWAEEGVATYVEPLARVRSGQITAEKVWGDLLIGLPKGLPKEGDRGLDRTPTWGRTYWGGALFWFLADLDIRERTENRRSLADALRGIVSAGGTIAHRWELNRALDAADRAVGIPALGQLYAKMGSQPMDVDLKSLFGKLGVQLRDGRVEFDDNAPLAAIRRSIIDGDHARAAGAE